MKTNTSGTIIKAGAWAVLGGLGGFALGVLAAPEPGQRTRRRLLYQLENMALRTGLLVERLFERRVGSDARRTGDALVADARERAQRIRDDIDALLEEMRQHDEARQQKASAERTAETGLSSN